MDADKEIRLRAAARIGQVLRGKYHVDSILGVGGMAVVYAATHRNKKRFAIKLLHPELSIRSDIRQRFLREGYAANSVGHASAVAILDDDVAEDGAAFLVMELLEGASAEALWESEGRRLGARSVLAIARGVVELLAVAHEKSIVHRDVKPANVFVATDGAVKVLDFGIARVKDATAESRATNTGTMLGTPAFMPPEQAGGLSSEVDGRTDLWSVGATMFTLLSGEYVHTGATPTQMAIFAATQPARSLASVMPDAPAAIVELVDRALAFDKGERWPSARAMADAIAAAESALFGGPAAEGELVALVDAYKKRSGHARAIAPTESVEGSDTELGPTIPQQITPAFTPASPRGPISPVAATTGGHVSEQTPPSEANGSRAIWPSRLAPLVALGVVAAAVVAIVAVRASKSGSHDVDRLAAPAVASGPAASSAAPPRAPAALAIAPIGADVEIDGRSAAVDAGVVFVEGAPGTMHLVHLASSGREATFPVLVTDTGAVPPRVELAPSGAPAPPSAPRRFGGPPARSAGSSPTSTPRAPESATSPPATSTSVSRTME